jgi:predicted negative regulator of RcsB-dependent stress response
VTQTEPREEEGFRARSRRRAIVLGVVVVIVAAAVSLLAWRSYRDQAEAEANALGQALAQAEAADDALRASVSSLAPVIQAARAVRTEAAGQLGESARSVRGLDEALRVAAALDSTVAGNPSAPPRTRAGAAAAQREDEGQLALVDPVLASLDAALNSAKSAVEASQLSAALGDLLDADHKLATAVRELSDFKVAVDRELLRLIAKWDLPPLTGPAIPRWRGMLANSLQ